MMNLCKMIKKACWFVIASASMCVGLTAFGVDVLALVGLTSFAVQLRYLVGACGAISLILLVLPCSSGTSCCVKK